MNRIIKESNRQPTSNGWTEGTPQHTHTCTHAPNLSLMYVRLWYVQQQQLPVFWRWSYIEKARRNHCFCCSFRSTNVRVTPSIHWIPFMWLGNLMLPIWWREDICTYSNVHTWYIPVCSREHEDVRQISSRYRIYMSSRITLKSKYTWPCKSHTPMNHSSTSVWVCRLSIVPCIWKKMK